MSKKLMCMMAIVALWAGLTQAELVGHWSLDEGTGTIAHDGTGNGHDGELLGSPQWVDAYYKMGLEFAGNPDKVDIPYSEQLNPDTAFSLSLWAKPDPSGSGHRSPITSRDDFPQRGYIIYIEPGNTWQYWIGVGSWNNTQGPAANLGEWTHVGATYDNGAKKFYINGEMVAEGSGTITPNTQQVLRIGGGATEGSGNYFWVGIVDDVAVFDHALTDAEIQSAMKGLAPPELAANPSPEDAVVDVPRDVTLQWESGDFAVKHDVYFGTAFSDVNSASVANPLGVLVGAGQSDNTYDAGILEFGQTYYWRVDEVNGAPDNTVFKGNVWGFTVEPYSIPVQAITATASSANAANMGPENTINGVGLNDFDQHSTEATDMWLSGMGDPTPSIQYDFDKAYKLHQLWVWNSNQLIESFVGLGAKDVVIEYSLDGAEWTVLEGAGPFAQATGIPTYTANTTVDFGGALAQHVKITVNAGYGMLPQYGLSEVRFYYIPTFPREPQPADGVTTAGAEVTLAWRAGREAATHEVYLGTDAQALTLAGTTTDSSYAATTLDYDTTYYWQVVEVNEAAVPTSHAGPIWSFSTPAYGTVDDFDRYDDDCNRIFFSWADGLGHSGGDEIEGCDVPASNGNGGGSIVGNEMAPFAEKTIVNAGSTQSLPFSYDNSFGPSEATLTLDGQDWTASGVQTLAIAFSGAAGNTGTLYVKINNVKVEYDRDPADIARSGWQAWNIDLSSVSGVQNVTSLTIGVDGATAAGMLYIDDIRLYPVAGELLTPVDPGDAGLLALYTFAGNYDDNSGNGKHGTPIGDFGIAIENDPIRGQVLSLPGGDDQYVEVGAVGISGTMPRTIACWAKADNTNIPDWTLIFGFTGQADGSGGSGSHFNIGSLGGPGGIGAHCWGWEETMVSDEDGLDWHHYAMTYDGTTIAYFADGVGIDTDLGKSNVRDLSTSADRVHIGSRVTQTSSFPGDVDDAVIYDRVLSAEEILFLAGRTTPIHKPF